MCGERKIQTCYWCGIELVFSRAMYGVQIWICPSCQMEVIVVEEVGQEESKEDLSGTT